MEKMNQGDTQAPEQSSVTPYPETYVLVAKYKTQPDGLQLQSFETIYTKEQDKAFRKKHAAAVEISELK